MSLRFDAHYLESIELAGGLAAHLRCVRPSDKVHLLEGFERLSPASRYRRFMAAKQRLSPAELRYLTEVDGLRHFALGALAGAAARAEHPERGLGAARFVCLDEAGRIAEPAIAVVDDCQGRGLGRILLDRLTQAARERGVTHFRSLVLADNVAMTRLIRSIAPEAVLSPEGSVVTVDFDLAEVPIEKGRIEKGPMDRLLDAVAAGTLAIRRAVQQILVDS